MGEGWRWAPGSGGAKAGWIELLRYLALGGKAEKKKGKGARAGNGVGGVQNRRQKRVSD